MTDYTEEELLILRKQKARANKRALAAAKKRGYQLNPRLEEMYADLEKTQPGGAEYVGSCCSSPNPDQAWLDARDAEFDDRWNARMNP